MGVAAGNGERLDAAALDRLFKQARTHNKWLDKDVPDFLLRELIDLVKWGPTSANCSPARFVFLKSRDAKEKLKPHLSEGNVEKTMQAPVCTIVAYDLEFYDRLPKLFPHTDARAWFAGQEKKIFDTAFRNGSLQGGYFILAARAMGLDCGPMSGFDNSGVDRDFFAGTALRSNFLCNLGYGDETALMARSPRLDFDEMAEIL
jgi:3-hydroxypropanoate dehydrogenase